MTTNTLVEHFFRHEYGKIVAMLSCRFGVEHVQDIEDAVQSALIAALESWTVVGRPENPTAWLFQVARNNLSGELRQQKRRQNLLRRHPTTHSKAQRLDAAVENDAENSLLWMLFICCDSDIPLESQLVFALKTLCGFNIQEIAVRLFLSNDNVYKRLSRARLQLRKRGPRNELALEETQRRLPAVHRVLYLLFTEGYFSSDAKTAIRQDLCEEAIRLTRILADNPRGNCPQTCALLALMLFHTARTPSRLDGSGGVVLLEEQNRQNWCQDSIREGLHWLARSAEGEEFSRYHAEAGIAAEHCTASSFEQTRWDRVVECYDLLDQSTVSPIHRLNRALAIAEWKTPADGLATLQDFDAPAWLTGSYLWASVLADLHRRCGNDDDARHYHEVAVRIAPSTHVRELLKRRFDS